jgi:hypothetical protein
MNFKLGNKEFDGEFFTLSYHANYTFINEGYGESIGEIALD